MTTVGSLLATARRRLDGATFSPSRREAALLLGHVLGLDEARILAGDDRTVAADDESRYEALLSRRLGGEPFAYVVGEREFYGRRFEVDERVLIPRPETEHLVEEALRLELPAAPRILDLGAGSGCLSVTLALELGGSAVAVDSSPGALAVTAKNAALHQVADRVRPVGSDLVSALAISAFDLVVTNPPYIERAEASDISPEILDFEPGAALFPPGGATAFFDRLFAGLEGLRPGTPVLMEIGYLQAANVAALLQESHLELLGVRQDYSGRDRVVRARRI